MGFSEIDFTMSGLPSQVRNGFDRAPIHTRDDSNTSSNDLHDIVLLNWSESQLGTRSLRSPPLLDSPVLESAVQSNGAFTLSKRGQHSLLCSTLLRSAMLRSSTPTQYPPQSTTSLALSKHNLVRSLWVARVLLVYGLWTAVSYTKKACSVDNRDYYDMSRTACEHITFMCHLRPTSL